MDHIIKPNTTYNFQTLLHMATSLPELSNALFDCCEKNEAQKVLNRHFDVLTNNLEEFERSVIALSYRPAFLIPFTGSITGLVKYCRMIKAQRDDLGENTNYLCFVAACKNVHTQLLALAEMANNLQSIGTLEQTIPPTLTPIMDTAATL